MTDESDGFAFYRDQLRGRVWSGFFNAADWEREARDIAYDPEGEPHIAALGEIVKAEFAAKREVEKSWPKVTDWDRLDGAFHGLSKVGILALHNAGYTTSDAHSDAWHIINTEATAHWRGFVFYHGQDVERAVQNYPLYLGYDAVSQDPEAKRALGMEIAGKLRVVGFNLDWDGDPEQRMSITNLDWKKRTEWDAETGTPAPRSPPPLATTSNSGFFRRLFG